METKNQTAKKSDFFKVVLMVCAIFLYALYSNVSQLFRDHDLDATGFHIAAGFMISFIIWLTIKKTDFKKWVFISFTAILYLTLTYLLSLETFRIFSYYESRHIFILMVVMIPILFGLFKAGLRKNKSQ